MSKYKQNIVRLDGKVFETKKPEIMMGRPIARVPMWENQVHFQRAWLKLFEEGYGVNPDDLEGVNWWLKHHSSSK